MSQIVKTEAIVLRKIDYGDTSKIADFYTRDFGRISAIIKGGRGGNQKVGRVVDPLNLLEIVIYQKQGRDIQTLSGADMVSYFGELREDYDSLVHALAILELIRKMIPEHEENPHLYSGTRKILHLMNEGSEPPLVLFLRFLIFFIKEIGYSFDPASCSYSGKPIAPDGRIGFDYERGMVLPEFVPEGRHYSPVTAELFDAMVCLTMGIKKEKPFRDLALRSVLEMLERFLMVHIDDFKGIQSLK